MHRVQISILWCDRKSLSLAFRPFDRSWTTNSNFPDHEHSIIICRLMDSTCPCESVRFTEIFRQSKYNECNGGRAKQGVRSMLSGVFFVVLSREHVAQYYAEVLELISLLHTGPGGIEFTIEWPLCLSYFFRFARLISLHSYITSFNKIEAQV